MMIKGPRTDDTASDHPRCAGRGDRVFNSRSVAELSPRPLVGEVAVSAAGEGLCREASRGAITFTKKALHTQKTPSSQFPKETLTMKFLSRVTIVIAILTFCSVTNAQGQRRAQDRQRRESDQAERNDDRSDAQHGGGGRNRGAESNAPQRQSRQRGGPGGERRTGGLGGTWTRWRRALSSARRRSRRAVIGKGNRWCDRRAHQT